MLEKGWKQGELREGGSLKVYVVTSLTAKCAFAIMLLQKREEDKKEEGH